MPLSDWYGRVRSVSWSGWPEGLQRSLAPFVPGALSARRLPFDVVAVTALVVAVFFERLDRALWLRRGFQIPDLTFVLAGLLVVAYAATLAYRRKLDLRRPGWVELTVVALLVVFGLTAIVAALSARTPAQSGAGSASRAPVSIIPAGRDRPYEVRLVNARLRQLRAAGSDSYFLHLTPVARKPAVLGFESAAGSVAIDQRRSYTYSVLLRTTSAPARVSVVLRQWAPTSRVKPFETTRRVKVRPSRWVRVAVSAEPAPGARVLEPLIVLPRLRHKTTLLLGSAELVSTWRVPLAIPAISGARYRLKAQGVTVSQHPSGSSGLWTVVARPAPGERGILRFRPSADTLLVHHMRLYRFTALFHSNSKPTRLTVGLRRSPTLPGAKPFQTTKHITVDSASWTAVTLLMEAAPGKVLEPFLRFPGSERRMKLTVFNAQLARQPKTLPPVLESHFSQSVKTIAHFAYLALIALLLGRILTPTLMRRAFATFFVLAVGASALALLQAIDQNVLHTGISQALHLVSRGGAGGFVRPCSIFSEPAFLGYYSVLGIIAGLWLRLQPGPKSRWISAGTALCLLAVLMAAAAGPVVALVPVGLYLLWRAAGFWRRIWRELTVVVVVGIAVLVFLPAGATLVHRASGILSGSDRSAQFRYAYDSASIRIWELSPLTGVGLGNTRFYMPSVVDLKFDPNLNAQSAQFQSVNSYLGTLSESGVFGLLMLTVMLLALFAPLGGRRRDRSWVTEAPMLLFIVAFFFFSAFADPIFWFWVGARLAQLRWQAEPEPVEARAPKPSLQPDAVG